MNKCLYVVLISFAFVFQSYLIGSEYDGSVLGNEDNPVMKLLTGFDFIEKNIDLYSDYPSKPTRVLVIGSTGAGKSSLIHGLVGRTLKRTLIKNIDGEDEYKLVVEPEQTLPGFCMSHTDVGTLDPVSFYDEAQNIIYWDCPGFPDTRGCDADIKNMYALVRLLEQEVPTKILLVVGKADIDAGRHRPFFEMIDLFGRCAENLPDLSPLVSLVITKSERKTTPIKNVVKGVSRACIAPQNASAGPVLDLMKKPEFKVFGFYQFDDNDRPYAFVERNGLLQFLKSDVPIFIRTKDAIPLDADCRSRVEVIVESLLDIRGDTRELIRLVATSYGELSYMDTAGRLFWAARGGLRWRPKGHPGRIPSVFPRKYS